MGDFNVLSPLESFEMIIVWTLEDDFVFSILP